MHPTSNVKPVPRIEEEYSSRDKENENSGTDEESVPSIIHPRAGGTADDGIKRNPSLIPHTGKHPFNAEPPLDLLMRHGFITPAPLHYVRSHGPVPAANWSEWTVEVCGLVKSPTTFTMDQLIADFNSLEFPASLVCSSNRRKELNMLSQTIGVNWGAAAISTSIWRGVPLRDVLSRCGIFKEALHVCLEGGEDLPGGGGGGSKYATSIREEVAMDPTRDIILAYLQNGERLPPDHGFPVRAILPGFTGGRMVKWLKRIIVTDEESDNYYHRMDNRMLPSHVVDFDLANFEGCWIKPEYVIYEMNINSVITTPCHGEMLAGDSPTALRSFTVRGFAFSGGGRKVTRVEMTMDGGVTWQLCELEHVEKPNKYGKYWCWCFWSLEVKVVDLFGAEEIAVRAWDESNNTQPENLNWNLLGMLNNSWFRVKISVCKSQNEGMAGIQFRHPTLPGNQSGGWMETDTHLIQYPSSQTLKKITSNHISSASNTYSTADVGTHNSPESAWIIVQGHVYDCTPFLNHHPGGADSILINAGTDCTDEFHAIHSHKAENMLDDYRIGRLIAFGRNIALIPHQKISCKLISKTSITPQARLFRFALSSEHQVLGLPVGNHIFLYATIHGKVCTRAYTPTSAVDEARHFDLVVKIYLKNVNPEFPNGGLMSQHLDSLPIGSMVEVKGPAGNIEYTGRGNFIVDGELKFAKKLAMVAGGTGITPIYQVVQAVLKDPADKTKMFVVYGNRREEEILLREELDSWGEKDERLRTWYVVEESSGEGWRYSVGFITDGILRDHIPVASEHTLALACGPPAMIEMAVKPMLERLNYDTTNSLLVF